jgi:uncharacterized protein (DUF934 family)
MPRRLLRNGEITVDEWQYLGEADPDHTGVVAEDTALILPLDQWLANRERWISRPGRIGVMLAPAHKIRLFAQDLGRFSLIGAEFPGPSEGRGYSQGRLLRDRWNFTGELRATGHIGRDHVFFLARCGFNSFELPDKEIEGARAALTTFSAAYQPSNDLGLAVELHHR